MAKQFMTILILSLALLACAPEPQREQPKDWGQASLCNISLMKWDPENQEEKAHLVGSITRYVSLGVAGYFGNIYEESKNQSLQITGVINNLRDAEIQLERQTRGPVSYSYELIGELKLSESSGRSASTFVDNGNFILMLSCVATE